MLELAPVKTILTNPFYFITMTQLIAPHGITDLFHAKSTDNVKNMVLIYTSVPVLGEILHINHLDNSWLCIMILSSIIHFQNDFHFLNERYRYFVSLLLITMFVKYESLISFFGYMITIHLPNHYKSSWPFIKDDLRLLSSLLIGLISFNTIELKTIDTDNINIVYSIIIAHVLYQEKYINVK